MRVLILFGSQSDQPIYNGVIDSFDETFETTFEIISAHRDNERLQQALKQYSYDLVVAGAGLAAHLPGVIASLTSKPVFGIPVAANFSGLDAFLSIVQMPRGVPVLATHPKNYWGIAKFIRAMRIAPTGIINIVSQDLARHKQLIDTAIENNGDVNFTVGENISSQSPNIVLVENEDQVINCSNAIFLPCYNSEEKKDITKALDFFECSEKGGLWVGANNIINAILFYKKIWSVLS